MNRHQFLAADGIVYFVKDDSDIGGFHPNLLELLKLYCNYAFKWRILNDTHQLNMTVVQKLMLVNISKQVR